MVEFLKGDFLDFFMYVIQHCFIYRHQISLLSEDDGIEPRTAPALVVTARHASTTRLGSHLLFG
jgi:hypothetical protein